MQVILIEQEPWVPGSSFRVRPAWYLLIYFWMKHSFVLDQVSGQFLCFRLLRGQLHKHVETCYVFLIRVVYVFSFYRIVNQARLFILKLVSTLLLGQRDSLHRMHQVLCSVYPLLCPTSAFYWLPIRTTRIIARRHLIQSLHYCCSNNFGPSSSVIEPVPVKILT